MKHIRQGSAMIDRMIMVAFIGILTIAALPAYGEYTVYAKATQGSVQASAPQIPLTEIYMTTGFF